MSFLKYLTNFYSSNSVPKSANDFIKKFIKTSKKRYTFLHMIYRDEIILYVDSLKSTNTWFKLNQVDSKLYKDGYVVYFILEKNEIESNNIYQNYLKSELNLIEVEKTHSKKKVIMFSYFLSKSTDYMQLALCMKKIIDNVYKFKEPNPDILFSLKYSPASSSL